MKALVLALLTASTLASAAATPVYECVDGSRYLRIYAGPGATFRGYHKSFAYDPKTHATHKTEQYKCARSYGKQFKCTKGDYILETYQNGRRRHVTVSLSGDFWPDSGYLHQIVCE